MPLGHPRKRCEVELAETPRRTPLSKFRSEGRHRHPATVGEGWNQYDYLSRHCWHDVLARCFGEIRRKGLIVASVLLQTSLKTNAAFSAISGTALLLGAIPVASLMGLPSWIVASVGASLLAFAMIVKALAGNPLPRGDRTGVRMVIAADMAWVAIAAIVIIWFPGVMTQVGVISLAAVSIIVADLATLQAIGLRKSTPDVARSGQQRPS